MNHLKPKAGRPARLSAGVGELAIGCGFVFHLEEVGLEARQELGVAQGFRRP
jgi:hypothetical protein